MVLSLGNFPYEIRDSPQWRDRGMNAGHGGDSSNIKNSKQPRVLDIFVRARGVYACSRHMSFSYSVQTYG